MKVIKINILNETPAMKGNGVNTAFIELCELLKEKNDVSIFINAKSPCDVLHSQTYGPYYFWKGRKYKGKKIITAHVIPDSIKGSLPIWKLLMPLVKWYFKKVYSYADVIIALSPTVEEEIKKLGVKTKITIIYNPVLSDHWQRTEHMRIKGREMLGLSDNDFLVLGVGQLQKRKGVEDFIDTAEVIPEAKFIWVGGRPFGKFTEGIARINARIDKASKHIKFIGMIDLEDMPYVYAAADVMLFPSYQENCPLAPIEAAASGMPVIFRDMKEYILLYDNPYLKAKSTQEFINLTKKLIHDKIFYKVALKISEQLITQFDKDKIRTELIGLYTKLASDSV